MIFFQNEKIMNKKQLCNLMLDILTKYIIDPYYDIPYLAGYNKQGTKIYLDKDLSFFFQRFPVYELLLIHQYIEKTEIDKGKDHKAAHEKATYLEKAACMAMGLKIDDYRSFMKTQSKTADSPGLIHLPVDLDLTAYTEKSDYEKLKKMFFDKHCH